MRLSWNLEVFDFATRADLEDLSEEFDHVFFLVLRLIGSSSDFVDSKTLILFHFGANTRGLLE